MPRQAALASFPFGPVLVNETTASTAPVQGSYLNNLSGGTTVSQTAAPAAVALASKTATDSKAGSATAAPAGVTLTGRAASEAIARQQAATPASVTATGRAATEARSVSGTAQPATVGVSPGAGATRKAQTSTAVPASLSVVGGSIAESKASSNSVSPATVGLTPASGSGTRSSAQTASPSSLMVTPTSASEARASADGAAPASLSLTPAAATTTRTSAVATSRQAAVSTFPFAFVLLNESGTSQSALRGAVVNETVTTTKTLGSVVNPAAVAIQGGAASANKSSGASTTTISQAANPASMAVQPGTAIATLTRAQGGSSAVVRTGALSAFPFAPIIVNEIGTVNAAVGGAYLDESPASPKAISATALPAAIVLAAQAANSSTSAAQSPATAIIPSRFALGLGLNLAISTAYFAPPQAAVSTFLGQVATRARIPTVVVSTSARQFNSRTFHYARDSITALKIAIPNWYVPIGGTGTYSETGTGGAASFTCSVEYPLGTFKQATFSGAATGTTADLTTLWTDFVAVTIPNGALFRLHIFGSLSGAVVASTYPSAVANTANGDAMEWAASGLVDKTMSGAAITETNVATQFFPAAIVAQTSKASVALIGDSRCAGAGDVYSGTSGDTGELARSVGPSLAYINFGAYGDKAQTFASGNNALRMQLASYCTHGILELGFNDAYLATSRTAAQVLGDLQTIRSALPTGMPVWLTTHGPRSNSTDNWATLANQTNDSARNPNRVALNNAIRAGVSGFAGFFEIADVVESARDSGYWMVPGYTADGLHETQMAYQAIQNAGVIDASLIAARPFTR